MNSKKKIVIITNIPSPYRVDLFYYIQQNITQYNWYVIYTSNEGHRRNWGVDKNKLLNTRILNAKKFIFKGKVDDREMHVAFGICNVLNEINPDIVIAFEYNLSAIQSLIWCKIKNRKFIHLTDGTLYSERNISLFQKLSRKIIISNSDALIASSTKSKEKLIYWGAKEEKVFISLLTVDLSQYKGSIHNPIKNRILYVGQIIYRKGIDLLLNALSKLDFDYELHIVGDSKDNTKDVLIDLSKKFNIYSKIKWCGYKSGLDLINEYRDASLFVLPTREDCFGLVLLEAAAMKVPILTSKYADGAYDIVCDNKNGLIVDPYDSNLFSEKIKYMLTSSEFENNMFSADLSKFEFNEVTIGYIEAIEYVLGESINRCQI